MNLRNLSIFSDNLSSNQPKYKSFGEYIFDTFNWLYEHSPINFSFITGMHHPSIQRLTGNPLLGRALEVTKDAGGLAKEIEALAKIAEKDPKGRAYLSFGFHPTLLVTRPEDIAQVFVHNGDNVDRGKLLDTFAKIFGETNLLTMPTNETWQQKRLKLTEWILQSKGLSPLVKPMQEIVDEFIAKMANDEGHIASLETFMVSLTMEVFARTGLASKLIDDQAQKISDVFGRALEVASFPMNTVLLRLDATLKYIGLCASKHLDKERDDLQKILKENFFEPNQENLLNKPNLLQEYFKQNPNDLNAAFQNTISDLGLLLLAGHETTSRLLQFTIILLAKHEDILEKLRDEITKNRPENGEWTFQDLKKLTYLEKIIKETLRLYPPIPIIPRMVTKSFVLADIPVCKTTNEYEKAMKERDTTKDVILHPGTGVDIAPWITHRLPSIYKDPLKFNPDRYKNSSIDSSESYSWIPFGAGSRNCPGRHFAMQEAELFLIQFVEKYDFKPSCKTAKLLETTMRGTLKHKGEIQLDITLRNDQSNRYVK